MASLALIAGEHSLGMLYLGRFLAGVCSGAAFAAGTAWIKELSVAPYDRFAGEQAGARRAAIALSAGFGLGPLVAGLLAQWAPHPLLTAYLPHLAVMLTALVLLAGTPETIAPAAHGLVLGDLLSSRPVHRGCSPPHRSRSLSCPDWLRTGPAASRSASPHSSPA